jgi:hypothetical protein
MFQAAELLAARNRLEFLDPVYPFPLDRTRRRLVVHEYEIIRLAEKVADRATRPDQAGNAGEEFVLEGAARYGIFSRTLDVGREFVLTVHDGKCLRVDDIVFGAKRIDRSSGSLENACRKFVSA